MDNRVKNERWTVLFSLGSAHITFFYFSFECNTIDLLSYSHSHNSFAIEPTKNFSRTQETNSIQSNQSIKKSMTTSKMTGQLRFIDWVLLDYTRNALEMASTISNGKMFTPISILSHKNTTIEIAFKNLTQPLEESNFQFNLYWLFLLCAIYNAWPCATFRSSS